MAALPAGTPRDVLERGMEPSRWFADSASDGPEEWMRARQKQRLRTYHATVVVTRAEEWCVDASSPDEAKELLLSGHGYRCHIGDVLHVEFERILDHE